jgi:CHASE3 domain sensor protein
MITQWDWEKEFKTYLKDMINKEQDHITRQIKMSRRYILYILIIIFLG